MLRVWHNALENRAQEKKREVHWERVCIYVREKSWVVMHLAAEHPLHVQTEAGSSQNACNDAGKLSLGKAGSIYNLISAQT